MYANPAADRVLGFVPEEQIGRNVFEFVHFDDLDTTATRFFEGVRCAGIAGPSVFRFQTATGDWRFLEATGTNCLADPAVRGIVVNARDVSEQINLTRVLRTLGQGNEVLVRATDETSLLSDMCKAIVSSGGYTLAWVGFAVHDEAKTVRPVASAGSTLFLAGTRFGWGHDEYGRGPTGTAIRTGVPQVLGDLNDSGVFAHWLARAREIGVRTSCALPLIVGDETIGALSIYAGEVGTFDPAAVEMLRGLADHLSYGIARLRDAKHLARSERLLREAERIAHVGHWALDLSDLRIEFLAEEMFAICGISPEEWGGRSKRAARWSPPRTSGPSSGCSSKHWSRVMARPSTNSSVEMAPFVSCGRGPKPSSMSTATPSA